MIDADLTTEIQNHLGESDDPDLWAAVCEELLSDVKLRAKFKKRKWPIVLEIGACSHWSRPHQTRTTRGGGFAYPTGYGEDGESTGRLDPLGLPQFDWSISVRLDEDSGIWMGELPGKGKRYSCRIAIPTRTVQHAQAAINATWLPYPPEASTARKIWVYGFRKIYGDWKCVTAPEFDLAEEK